MIKNLIWTNIFIFQLNVHFCVKNNCILNSPFKVQTIMIDLTRSTSLVRICVPQTWTGGEEIVAVQFVYKAYVPRYISYATRHDNMLRYQNYCSPAPAQPVANQYRAVLVLMRRVNIPGGAPTTWHRAQAVAPFAWLLNVSPFHSYSKVILSLSLFCCTSVHSRICCSQDLFILFHRIYYMRPLALAPKIIIVYTYQIWVAQHLHFYDVGIYSVITAICLIRIFIPVWIFPI